MAQFGYTMMCEQSRPDQLVRDVQMAEAAGFEFSAISDHYQPWLAEQGHSGYAWSILGAAAQATETIGLMTYVPCPILRYHPAVVAQKAATVQILSGNRFRLGLGAGENLNAHVVGKRWPAVGVRHEMLSVFDVAGGSGKPRVGQIALAYDPDRDAAVQRATSSFGGSDSDGRSTPTCPIPSRSKARPSS